MPSCPRTVAKPPMLLDAVRRVIRERYFSLRTEEQYVCFARGFVNIHKRRYPCDLGTTEIRAYLSMLANERRVSASTHHQALSALLFLYRRVLGVELPWLDGIERPRRPARLPVVLTHDEEHAVFTQLRGEHLLLARLLYGTGMRIAEALQLRVKDFCFDRRTQLARQGACSARKRQERRPTAQARSASGVMA